MRTKQEIQGLLQTWPDGFENSFGRRPSSDEIKKYLTELKAKRELESFKNQFDTFRPFEIDLALEVIAEKSILEVSKVEKKKAR